MIKVLKISLLSQLMNILNIFIVISALLVVCMHLPTSLPQMLDRRLKMQGLAI